jgi:hypothetical protein
VRLSAGHKKIIIYSVPGKEAFYESFGSRRMTTAMAIFEDPESAFARGYIARPWRRAPRPEIAVNMPQLADRVFAVRAAGRAGMRQNCACWRH